VDELGERGGNSGVLVCRGNTSTDCASSVENTRLVLTYKIKVPGFLHATLIHGLLGGDQEYAE
jgi:hypothetical protein